VLLFEGKFVCLLTIIHLDVYGTKAKALTGAIIIIIIIIRTFISSAN